MAVAVAATTYAGAKHSVGDLFSATRTITFDNSYVTGGEPVTAAQFGMTRIRRAEPVIVTVPGSTGIVVVPVVQANGSVLLKAMTAAIVEVASESDQSALICQVTVHGE